MKKILLLVLLFVLSACAPKISTLPEKGAEVSQAWEKMRQISREHANKPARLQISLRFGKEGDTRRVTGLLWGQGDDLRLDIMAGVGAIIAKIQDKGDRFLLYVPQENRAYEHEGPNKPLLRVGTPLPFNLHQLAALLNGDYASVFGESASFLDQEKTQACFELEQGGKLWLAESGVPEKWQSGPWQLQLSYQDNQQEPHSLRLTNTDGNMAVLLVKERETPSEAFTQAQMELDLPDGVDVMPLSQYKNN